VVETISDVLPVVRSYCDLKVSLSLGSHLGLDYPPSLLSNTPLHTLDYVPISDHGGHIRRLQCEPPLVAPDLLSSQHVWILSV
jgi:hypothetical protein